MRYYHINMLTLEILSGPHEIQSTYIRRLTSCGNPELLDLSTYGLVPEVYETLTDTQKHGIAIVSADAVTFPAIAKTAGELAAEAAEAKASEVAELEVQTVKLFFKLCKALVVAGVLNINDPNLSEIKTAYQRWKTLTGN